MIAKYFLCHALATTLSKLASLALRQHAQASARVREGGGTWGKCRFGRIFYFFIRRVDHSTSSIPRIAVNARLSEPGPTTTNHSIDNLYNPSTGHPFLPLSNSVSRASDWYFQRDRHICRTCLRFQSRQTKLRQCHLESLHQGCYVRYDISIWTVSKARD